MKLPNGGRAEAVPGIGDDFGTRYTIDFEIVRSEKRTVVRSAWIVRNLDGIPTMTTCYCVRRARVIRISQVGTIVEELAPGVFEVEFSDDSGMSYASLAVRSEDLLRLHYAPVHEVA